MTILKIYFYAITSLLAQLSVENLPNNSVTLRTNSYRHHVHKLLCNLYDEAAKVYGFTNNEFAVYREEFWAINSVNYSMNNFVPLSKIIFNTLENNQSAKDHLFIYIIIVEALIELDVLRGAYE